jgi:hypothetical protein
MVFPLIAYYNFFLFILLRVEVRVTIRRGYGLADRFIAHSNNLLLHFTKHNMTHYAFSSALSSASSREVKVTLRLTVGQSVSLGVDRIFIIV